MIRFSLLHVIVIYEYRCIHVSLLLYIQPFLAVVIYKTRDNLTGFSTLSYDTIKPLSLNREKHKKTENISFRDESLKAANGGVTRLTFLIITISLLRV